MQTENAIQLKPYGYIYKVTNNFNGKCYIGQSIDRPEEGRWKAYKRLNCKKQHKLYNTLKKNGPENFIYEIIATGFDKTNLDFLEDTYEICYDSINNGYNIRRGGSHGKHSEETKQKMSISSKGNKGNLGRKFTEEHKGKLSNARKGFKPSTLSIEKSAAGHRGIKYSDEIRQKLSESHKGFKHTEETKRKITESNKGLKRSEETKRKLSMAKKGKPCKPFTDEHRRKIAETKMRKRMERLRIDYTNHQI